MNFKNFQITTFALCVRLHTNSIKIIMIGSMSMNQLVNKISLPAHAEKGHGPRIDLFLIEWFMDFFIGKECNNRRDKSVQCIVEKCILWLQGNRVARFYEWKKMTHCKLQLSLCNVYCMKWQCSVSCCFPVFCFSILFNKTFTNLWGIMTNLDYFFIVHVLSTVHYVLVATDLKVLHIIHSVWF